MRNRLPTSMSVVAAFLSTWVLFAGQPPVTAREGSRPPNVVLIVPDALRAKQLPVYRPSDIQTPTIDHLARSGVVFERCFVRFPGTTISFSNLFSGKLFPTPALREDSETTLAEVLRQRGYATVGVVSSERLWFHKSRVSSLPSRGFYRGFDDYFQEKELQEHGFYRNSRETTADVIGWFDTDWDPERPFFLFVHYMDPHAPYTPSYDAEIEKIDVEISRIIAKLKEIGQYDNSLIILTSDHGESLGDVAEDHNSPAGHGYNVYLEQIQVPLIMRFPDDTYRRAIPQVVRNMDIMPTVLDYLGGYEESDDLDGVSLMPAVRTGEDLDLVAFNENGPTRVCPDGLHGVVFRHGESYFHFIRSAYSARVRELYRIDRDPDERTNLYGDDEFRTARLQAEDTLEVFQEPWATTVSSAAAEEEDREAFRALTSLGYLAGGAPVPYVENDRFVMQRDLGGGQTFEFVDLMRDSGYGASLDDSVGPKKIVTRDNDTHYLIANEGRELFRYEAGEGFRFLGVTGVEDLALSATGESMYLVVDGRVERARAPRASEITSRETVATDRVHDRWTGVHVGADGAVYLFSANGIHVLNDDAEPVAWLEQGGLTSERFATNGQGARYVVLEDGVAKVARGGRERRYVFHASEDRIASIDVDERGRLWILRESEPEIVVVGDDGVEIDRFSYNLYPQKARRGLTSLQIHVCGDRVHIVDSWESILVYQLGNDG